MRESHNLMMPSLDADAKWVGRPAPVAASDTRPFTRDECALSTVCWHTLVRTSQT